jgi:serine/threonine protein kinase
MPPAGIVLFFYDIITVYDMKKIIIFGIKGVKMTLNNLLKKLDDKTIKEIIISEKLLGKGHHKNVFLIPNFPDFVLAVIKNLYDPEKSVKPFVIKRDLFPGQNFGQSVAESSSGLIIMKRVSGISHGVQDWPSKVEIAHSGEPLSTTDAIYFYNQIKKLVLFPIQTYETFAMQLKKFADKNIRIDAINPNNLLINNKDYSIHIIDFDTTSKPDDLSGCPTPVNSLYDMYCLLLDSKLHCYWIKSLPDDLRKDFIENCKKIIKKCKTAAISVGLNINPDSTNYFFKTLSKKHPRLKLWKDYEAFINLYKDFLTSKD